MHCGVSQGNGLVAQEGVEVLQSRLASCFFPSTMTPSPETKQTLPSPSYTPQNGSTVYFPYELPKLPRLWYFIFARERKEKEREREGGKKRGREGRKGKRVRMD